VDPTAILLTIGHVEGVTPYQGMKEKGAVKRKTALVTRVAEFAVFACINSDCEEGEFAARVPPLYVNLPACPCCGCPSLLEEVLYREGQV